jgi:hypothetical protein
MKTKLFVAVFALLGAIISVPTSATATTYTYTGNTFNLTHTCTTPPCFPATVPANISLNFVLNFDSANASGTFDVPSGDIFSARLSYFGAGFDDVRYPINNMSSSFIDSLSITLISGLVTGWSFTEHGGAGPISHQISSTGSRDSANILNFPDQYSGSGRPGVWSGPIADQFSEVPLPATLPLFATGLAALGLLGWRRKRPIKHTLTGFCGGFATKAKLLAVVAALALLGFAPASETRADILTVSFSALPQTVAPNEQVELKLTLTIPTFQIVPGGPTGSQFIQNFGGETVTIADGQGNSSTFIPSGIASNTFIMDAMYAEAGDYHPDFFGTVIVFGVGVPPPQCNIFPAGCPGITVRNIFDISGETTVHVTPIPAALPLFATGLGALGLFGWRRKKKAAALAA